MLKSLFGAEALESFKEDVSNMVFTLIMKNRPNIQPDKKILNGYCNQATAVEYAGSRKTLAVLEKNGLSRYEIDGMVRYKVSEIDEVMEIFRV